MKIDVSIDVRLAVFLYIRITPVSLTADRLDRSTDIFIDDGSLDK